MQGTAARTHRVDQGSATAPMGSDGGGGSGSGLLWGQGSAHSDTRLGSSHGSGGARAQQGGLMC